jgi:hypothetical protein
LVTSTPAKWDADVRARTGDWTCFSLPPAPDCQALPATPSASQLNSGSDGVAVADDSIGHPLARELPWRMGCRPCPTGGNRRFSTGRRSTRQRVGVDFGSARPGPWLTRRREWCGKLAQTGC